MTRSRVDGKPNSPCPVWLLYSRDAGWPTSVVAGRRLYRLEPRADARRSPGGAGHHEPPGKLKSNCRAVDVPVSSEVIRNRNSESFA